MARGLLPLRVTGSHLGFHRRQCRRLHRRAASARAAAAISVLKSRLMRLRLACRLPRRRSRAASLTSPIQRYCSTPRTPHSTNSPATKSQESAVRRRCLPMPCLIQIAVSSPYADRGLTRHNRQVKKVLRTLSFALPAATLSEQAAPSHQNQYDCHKRLSVCSCESRPPASPRGHAMASEYHGTVTTSGLPVPGSHRHGHTGRQEGGDHHR